MKLLHNNILIERIPVQLPSLIHTPNGFTLEVQNTGRVLDVGPGRLTKRGYRVTCDVQPGDVVTFYELAECHRTANPNEVVINEESIWFVHADTN